MEKIVYLKRRETHFNWKYFVWHAYIFHVSLLHAKTSKVESREDSERFSLG